MTQQGQLYAGALMWKGDAVVVIGVGLPMRF